MPYFPSLKGLFYMKNLALFLLLLCYIASPVWSQKNKNKEKTTAELPFTKKEKKAESWWYYAIFDNQVAEENVQIADLQYHNGKLEKWSVFDKDGKLNYTYLYDHDLSNNQIKRFIENDSQKARLDYIETFNRLQQLTQREVYNSLGQVIEKKIWQYNGLGQKISEKTLQLSDKKELELNYEIQYEIITDLNSVIESHNNHSNYMKHQIAIQYNTDNLPIEECYYQSTGELIQKIIYVYDQQSRLIEKLIYPNGVNMQIKETYVYSALNNEVIHATYTNQGQELAEYIVYRYEYE